MQQQVQDKQQQKSLNNEQQLPSYYQPSPFPTILSTTAKVCYGLSAASIVLSVGVWNRIGFGLPVYHERKLTKSQERNHKPSEREYRESQRLGAFVGLWAPTFVIAGKILDDASERVAQYEFAQWEKKQAEKIHSPAFRARFFSR